MMPLKKLSCAIACLFLSPVHAVGLKEAIRAAEKIDPVLAASSANRDAGAESYYIARAKLLPTVAAQGTFNKSNQSNTQNGLTRDYKVNATNSQIYFRQGLFKPRDWAGLSIGQLQSDYADYKLASAYGDLWQRVAVIWIDILSAQETVRIYQTAYEGIRKHAEQARLSYQKGVSTKDAAAEALARQEQTRVGLEDAKLNLAAKLRAFQAVTGIQNPQFQAANFSALKTVRVPMNGGSEELTQKTLDAGPDILATRATEEIRRLQLSQAKYDHLPSVDIVGSHSNTNNDNINQIGSKVNTSLIGIQVSVPIFSGGGLTAQQRQAAATYSAAKYDTLGLELQLKTQIDLDWSADLGYLERLKGAESLVEASRDQVRAAQLGLKAGTKSWSDVGGAYLNLINREFDRINLMSAKLKTQLKLLNNLAVSDPAWDLWIAEVEKYYGANKK